MKTRPWIWLIIGQVLAIAALLTMVRISHVHAQREVPLHYGR